MRFLADSDSEITRGFCYCLVSILDGAAPEEVLAMKTDDLEALNVGLPGVQRSRVNTRALIAERRGKDLCIEISFLICFDRIELIFFFPLLFCYRHSDEFFFNYFILNVFSCFSVSEYVGFFIICFQQNAKCIFFPPFMYFLCIT